MRFSARMTCKHDRGHHETDRVIDEKGGQDSGQHRHGDEQNERRMRMADDERAQHPESAGNLEMRDDDHHAGEHRDRVELDGPERLVELHRPERDHRRPAEEGEAGAVEAQARNAARGHSDIGEDEDGEGDGGGKTHASGWFHGRRFAARTSGRGFVARLGHEEKEDPPCDRGGGPKKEERRRIAEAIRHGPGRQRADRSPDPLRGGDGALREIVAAGPAHDVGDQERRQRLIDARADAVEKLHAEKPEGVVGKGVERRADRQHGEGDEEDRPPPDPVGVAADIRWRSAA